MMKRLKKKPEKRLLALKEKRGATTSNFDGNESQVYCLILNSTLLNYNSRGFKSVNCAYSSLDFDSRFLFFIEIGNAA